MIVYLHAGTHKTGTTALQAFLYANRDLLNERGLYLPTAGLVGTPPMMAHHNVPYELGGHLVDPNAGGTAELFAELAACGADKAIVSSENFYALAIDPNALRRLRSEAERIGAEIRPILYLRPQATLIEALYVEFVKHGMCASFDDFLSEALDHGTVTYNEATYDLEYDRLAASFAGVFGHEAMTLVSYADVADGDGVVAHALSLLLPDAGIEVAALGGRERYNISIGFRAVASMVMENRSKQGEAAFEDVLDELMRSKREPLDALLRPHGRYWDGKFEPLVVDDVARLLSRFGDGNRILEGLYGVSVPVCEPNRLFAESRGTQGR